MVTLPVPLVWRISTCIGCGVNISGFEPDVEQYAACSSCGVPWQAVKRFDAGALCSNAHWVLQGSRIREDE